MILQGVWSVMNILCGYSSHRYQRQILMIISKILFFYDIECLEICSRLELLLVPFSIRKIDIKAKLHKYICLNFFSPSGNMHESLIPRRCVPVFFVVVKVHENFGTRQGHTQEMTVMPLMLGKIRFLHSDAASTPCKKMCTCRYFKDYTSICSFTSINQCYLSSNNRLKHLWHCIVQNINRTLRCSLVQSTLCSPQNKVLYLN